MADDSSSFLYCKRLTSLTSLLLSKFISVISKLMILPDTSLVSVFVLYLFIEGRMMRRRCISPINVKACRRHYVPLPHRVSHIPENW